MKTAVDTTFEVTEAQAKAVDKVVALILRFGLSVPAILCLESMRPLNFLGSQFMHLMSPAVHTLVPMAEWDHLAHLLEERQGVEYLIQRIEVSAEEKASG